MLGMVVNFLTIDLTVMQQLLQEANGDLEADDNTVCCWMATTKHVFDSTLCAVTAATDRDLSFLLHAFGKTDSGRRFVIVGCAASVKASKGIWGLFLVC